MAPNIAAKFMFISLQTYANRNRNQIRHRASTTQFRSALCHRCGFRAGESGALSAASWF